MYKTTNIKVKERFFTPGIFVTSPFGKSFGKTVALFTVAKTKYETIKLKIPSSAKNKREFTII